MQENEANKDFTSASFVPFIGLREGVIFPETEAVLTFGRPASITGISEAFANEQEVCFVSQRDSKATATTTEDYYSIGTVCRITKTLPVNDELHAIVKGLFRVKIRELENREGRMWAVVENLDESRELTPEITALGNRAVAEIKKSSGPW